MPFSFIKRFFSTVSPPIPTPLVGTLPPEFNNKQFFFLHIPKTAGSSFRRELERHFAQENIMPSQALRKEVGGYPPFTYVRELSKAHLAKIKLISGHYQYREVSDHFVEKPLLLIMMREPLSRCISECLHILRHPTHDMHTYLPDNPDLADITDSHEVMHYLANVVPMMLLPDLTDAKQLIENSAFLGIQERMDDSSKLLAHTFEWQVEAIPVFNSLPQTQIAAKQDIADDVIERFRAILGADYELYQFACDIFESRLTKANL